MIVIHPGLPKTATTFLQKRVFPKLLELNYIHRKQDGCQEVCQELTRALRRRTDANQAQFNSVAERFAALYSGNEPSLISDEGLSITVSDFWEKKGISPSHWAKNLQAFMNSAGVPKGAFKVMIGIRNQSNWFASRYAQSAARYPEFSQEDFETRVEEASNYFASAPGQWLFFDSLYEIMSELCGPGNVLFMPVEGLSDISSGFLESVEAFVGCALPKDEAIGAIEANSGRISLSDGENAWRFRGRDGRITMDNGLCDGISQHFAVCNKRVAALTGLDLGAFGYY